MSLMGRIPKTVAVGSLEVAVSVSQRRKSVRLTVERDASVSAVVPPNITTEELVNLVKSRRSWLFAKLSEVNELGQSMSPKQFITGEGFPYLGRSYRLRVVAAGAPTRLVAGRLELGAGGGASQIVEWYRRAGSSWLRRRVKPWSEVMATEVHQMHVRPLGYRWGSCATDRSLNIHWATMQLPPTLVDYVLVHELAHLTVPDHGPDFWMMVERALPDAQERRRRLRLVGPELWLPSAIT